jgi:hypothetical protein
MNNTCAAIRRVTTIILAIAIAIPFSSPVRAFADSTTENITTPVGLGGTRTTNANGDTTTVVDSVSGTIGVSYVEQTSTTTSFGNPVKTQTVATTTKFFDKKGGKLTATDTTSITRSAYNEAGGYHESTTVTHVDTATGNKTITETETDNDAAGNPQSGTEKKMFFDKDGKKLAQPMERTFKDGTWQDVSLDPQPETQTAQHHRSLLPFWVIGAGVAVALLSHKRVDANQLEQLVAPPIPQVAFAPSSIDVCVNKGATASIADPAHPGAVFVLGLLSTDVIGLGSETTTGPIDITPFNTGSTSVTATEVGTGKTASLPVTVTPAC